MLTLLLGFFASNQVEAQTSITALGTSVSQNFNSVAAGTWTNNTTPNAQGWYSTINGTNPGTLYANTGSVTTSGRIYVYASAGTPGDKALGVIVSGTTGASHGYVGWRLKNAVPATVIKSLRITWTGEQWASNASGGANQYLYLYYSKGTTVTSLTAGSWFTCSSNFQAPKYSSTSVLDGNLAANRSTQTLILTDINIAANTEIMLRWDLLKYANFHQMGIDDVTVTALMDQEITFDPLNDVTYGDSPFTLAATTTSGLPITYSSSNNNVATVDGNTVTIVGPGTVNITASQAGNEYYNSATVINSLNVKPQTPEVTPATNIASDGFTANWTIDNGSNDASTTYIVTYSTDKNFAEDVPGVTVSTAETSNKYFNLNPSNGYPLAERTIYYYKVYAINNGVYSEYSPAAAITTGTNFVSSQNGIWDTNNSWVTNDSPLGLANNVTIGHEINSPNTARDSIFVNSLILETGGKLTNAEKIHVANNLIIKVDADGNTGKILNNSTINLGNGANIIIRKTFAAGKWHFVGFPFNISSVLRQNGTAATWGNVEQDGYDFYVQKYNGSGRAASGIVNTSGSGLNWANVSPHAFVARQGYIIYTDNAITLDFVAKAKDKLDIFKTSSNVGINLYPSGISNLHSGWNLVASPFVCSYDLYNSSANSPYYVYNGTNYSYVMSGDHYNLQPYTSFFLQASTTNFAYVNAGRRVLAPSVKNEVVDFDEIGINIKNSTYNDLTRIRLKDNANTSYVIGEDAVKMFSMTPAVPQLYSYLNSTSFAVNTLPYTVKEVELYTKIGTTGTYTVELSPDYYAPNCKQITLVDKVTGTQTNLLAGSYSYSATSTGTTNRFKVVISADNSQVTTSLDNNESNSVTVSINDNNAMVSGLSTPSNILIFDMSGKQVYSFNDVNNQQILQINKKGLLLFQIYDADKVYNIKALNK